MNPGDRVVVLRPVQPEISIPCEGTILMVVPAGDSYQYMIVFDDGQRACCEAENTYHANWLGLASCMEMPGVLEEDWQADLHRIGSTEADLPFDRWVRLKFDLADHILEGLTAFGVLTDAEIPEAMQKALEYYFQVDDEEEVEDSDVELKLNFPEEAPEYEI